MSDDNNNEIFVMSLGVTEQRNRILRELNLLLSDALITRQYIAKIYSTIYLNPRQTVPLAAGIIKILFVDTGNTGRSVMAEAIANKIIATNGLNVAVISRGYDVNSFISYPELDGVTLLQNDNIADVSGHAAVQMSVRDINRTNIIILNATQVVTNGITALFPYPNTQPISKPVGTVDNTLSNMYTLGNFANGAVNGSGHFIPATPVMITPSPLVYQYDIPDAYGQPYSTYESNYTIITQYVTATLAGLPNYVFTTHA